MGSGAIAAALLPEHGFEGGEGFLDAHVFVAFLAEEGFDAGGEADGFVEGGVGAGAVGAEADDVG